ncbi:M48 family metalloprotease [Leucobacter chromiireducens]|uniref:M56 family peptidase n=1 Tax=Leucobacter chromiireducens subsp. solipictus TaxID=398235 RepID=A0ABS1SGL2_9MICO|nr:M56 family peptidase [Leucobacter chromiireducens subsp. solipictus]
MTGAITGPSLSVVLITALLTSVLLIAALGGPRLMRAAAPAFAAAPRVASGALIAAALLWIAGLVAIGPVVAWMSAGPSWLPDAAARVCGRCLMQASPFGASAAALGIPAIVPLALPALGAALVMAGLLREGWRVRRSRAALLADLRRRGTDVTLRGVQVRLLDDAAPRAFSLPHRDAGIVVSLGTLRALSGPELSAVLAHEGAHLRQRHHGALGLLLGATHAFRWVPLIRAIRDAVPHTLEIAADRAATRITGTPALASALLKLGAAPADPEQLRAGHPAHSVLHAAASDRIQSLIGQRGTPISVALAAGAGLYAVMLAGVVAAVHVPYLLAIATGC